MPVLVHYRRFLFFLLVVFAGAACHTPEADDPDIIVTFPPEFTVDLFEQRDANTGAAVFGLWVESMAIFDCNNYRIETATTVSADAIDIQLLEVSKPDTCLGLPGRAHAFLPLGRPANGVYRFTFTLGSAIVNEGVLTVLDGHYELSLPNAQGIDFQNRVLESIPEHYVWGYAFAPAEPDLPVADQFIAGLKSLTAEPALPPGYYGYFTVGGSGQYYFHKSINPEEQNRPFLRRLNGGPDTVRSLLQSFRDDATQPLELRCFSTYGEL